MDYAMEQYFDKRGEILVKNLKSRHFDAVYCKTNEEALAKALEWIPEESVVGWGGAFSAQQIGLMDALNNGNYKTIDRAKCSSAEQREQAAKDCMFSDVFISGANALSLDGQMVNIDGTGNRVGAIIYGPKKVIVIAGMNKVCDTMEEAVKRAREVAAPLNMMRFMKDTPCAATGKCGDCKQEGCICNQIVITRHCRPVGRIQFVLVGEQLGL